ncbi:MAG: hypothetical protein U0Q22_17680 [Acidimicrobiales bacterium]
MQQIVFLFLATCIGVVVFKLRSNAARERKSVMERLATERTERGDYSPTAELFREAGVPTFERLSDLAIAPVDTIAPVETVVPVVAAEPTPETTEPSDDALDDLPAPTGEPAASVSSDLRTLYRGIAMPAGLRPLGPLAPEGASFVTGAAPSDVHAGLDAEFERLGCSTRWVAPTIAETERNGERGLVTIYPNPVAAIDLDGEPLFPEVAPGHVVVRMLAL